MASSYIWNAGSASPQPVYFSSDRENREEALSGARFGCVQAIAMIEHQGRQDMHQIEQLRAQLAQLSTPCSTRFANSCIGVTSCLQVAATAVQVAVPLIQAIQASGAPVAPPRSI